MNNNWDYKKFKQWDDEEDCDYTMHQEMNQEGSEADTFSNSPTTSSDTLKGTSNSDGSDNDSVGYPDSFVTERYYDTESDWSEGHENSPDSTRQAYELSTPVDQHCLARALENIIIDLEEFTNNHPTGPRRSNRTIRRPYSYDETRRRGK